LTIKLILDSGITWTHCFHDADIEDYDPPTVGTGWDLSPASSTCADSGTGCTSVGGECR